MPTEIILFEEIERAISKYHDQYKLSNSFAELEQFNNNMIANGIIKKEGYNIASPAEMAFKPC